MLRSTCKLNKNYDSGTSFIWKLWHPFAKDKNANQIIGDLGEQITSNFLIKNGHYIWHRNWSNKQGEIDLITTKNRTLNIIEVKTRHHSLQTSFPAENAVDIYKQKQIKSLTKSFKMRHKGNLKRRHIFKESYDVAVVYYQESELPLLINWYMEYMPDAFF